MLSRRQVITSLLALPALRSAAQTSPQLSGWREAILIIPDPAPWIETLTVVGGWEVVHRGPADRALNRLWSLPDSAMTEQVLIRNIGTETGFIRLVRVEGAPQRLIRPDDQAWETGGIAAIDLRVVDIESTRAALHQRGWRAPSDPVRYHAYGVEVIQWAPISPDGIRLSFIQRIAPPLQGWSELKQWSRAANAAISVADMAAAQAFFAKVLGLTEASHTDTVGGDGPNVMGLPWAFSRRLAVDIRGFAGSGRDGAIELIAMPEAQGRDYAGDAHPPNLGIAGLRFMVGDAASLAGSLRDRGIALAAPLTLIDLPPFGRSRTFAVTAPDGVWLEFHQLL